MNTIWTSPLPRADCAGIASDVVARLAAHVHLTELRGNTGSGYARRGHRSHSNRCCPIHAMRDRHGRIARFGTPAPYARRPQKYGTQFVPDGERYRLWDLDPATTGGHRAAWDVPPLADQLRRAEEMTRLEPQPPMSDLPAWLQAAVGQWRFAPGSDGQTDVVTVTHPSRSVRSRMIVAGLFALEPACGGCVRPS